MRITIAAIGRLKDHEHDLVARYIERFDGVGRRLALGPLRIVELPESRAPAATGRKTDEAARLRTAIAAADVRVALDEGGSAISSRAFAERLAALRDEGFQHVAFQIGGPDGHADSVLNDARWRLSLGAMTLPHGIARIVLAEQLYRAATIIAGHPYHRD